MEQSLTLGALLLLLCALTCLPSGDGHKMAPNTSSAGPVKLPPHRFFLQHIFDKYGHRGVMSFEGFEHLLDSLGLGHLDLSKSHNLSVHKVNGTFQEIHDTLELHHHDHRIKRAADPKGQYEELVELLTEYEVRNRDQQQWINHCLSPQDILVTYGLEPDHGVVISPLRFLHLCPAIVYELDQRSCYRDTTVTIHEENHKHSDAGVVMHQLSVWLYASLSILIISLTGLLGVAMVPLVQKAFYHHLLHFLVAMAVGTLCGDALLHLLPHALMPHSHNHDSQENDHSTAVLRAAVTFFSIGFLFLLEGILHHFKNMSEQRTQELNQNNASLKRSESFRYGSEDLETATEISVQTPLRHSHHSHGHHQHHLHHAEGETSVSSVAWMVIAGDGLHNLTDGLAIGAAFSGDIVAGFATALAVFCHELPHELGDFAVLLKSGMSIKKALIYNIFSSVLSFIGMAIGVWLGNYDSAALWIYAVTAGTFLYIALADLVPEMNTYSEGARSFAEVVLQLAGIATGGIIMLIIALYEDKLSVIFQQS